MPSSPITYSEAEHFISSYFDEHLNIGIKEFRSGFTKPLLENLTSLRTDLFKIKKDDPQRYDRIIEQLSITLEKFNVLFSKSTTSDIETQWKDLIFQTTANIPEQIICIQGEERFQSGDNDSVITKNIKGFKRAVFSVSKLFARSGSDAYKWHQKIPLKYFIQYELLGKSEQFRDSITFEYSLLGKALMFLLKEIKEEIKEEISDQEQDLNEYSEEGQKQAKSTDSLNSDTESQTEEKPTENVFEGGEHPYRIPAISEIEEHISEAIALLKEYQEAGYNYSPVLRNSRDNLREDLHKVGTAEFQNSQLKPEKLEALILSKSRQAGKAIDKWETYIQSQLSDLKVQLELSQFGADLEDAQEELLEQTHTYFRDVCYIPTENGISTLKDIIEKLKGQKSAKKSIAEIQAAREQLQNEFMENSIYVMQNEHAQESFLSETQRQLSDIELRMNQFSDSVLLAEKRKFKLPLPELTLDTFAWRSIASRFLKNEAIDHIRPEKQDFAGFISGQLADIEEAAGIVDINLQAATTSEEKTGDESPLEIAVSGSERAINALERSIKQIREKQNSYETLIREKLPAAFQRLAILMLERRYDEFEMRDKALQAKETALSWKEKFIKFYAVAEDNLELAWRYSKVKVKNVYLPVSKFLGFSTQSQTSNRKKQDITEYLTQNKKIDEKLPFIYQRLFKRSFTIDKRFFIDANENISSLQSGYEQWCKNIAWNMAIVGQKGSGKTTLLHFFEQEVDCKHDVVTISIDFTLYDPATLIKIISKQLGFAETDDVDVLIAKIKKSRKKRILIFEGLQNLYIRHINGYDAIHKFWELLTQTSDKLFWLVTSSGNAWQFFIKMFDADQFFSHIVRTDQLTQKQIETGIISRHKATGYELRFTANEAIRKSRAFKKLLGDETDMQTYLRERFFEQLAKIADGNFSIAMIFWLNAIEDFNETHCTIAPLQIADIDILETPSRDVLFTLATLIRHDTLTAEETALSLHQNVAKSKLMLGRLKSKGLIVQTNSGYTVNHLVYRQTIRLLTSRNIIH